MKSFSPTAAISAAFSLTKSNWVFLVVLMLLFTVLMFAGGIVSGIVQDLLGLSDKVTEYISNIFVSYISAGLLIISLKVVDGQPLKYTNIFASFDKKLLNYVILSVVFWLIGVISAIPIFLVLGGSLLSNSYDTFIQNPNLLLSGPVLGAALLTVIISAYVGLRFGFAVYGVFDIGLDAIESLKHSWNITKGNVLRLLGFELLSILVIILGLLALVLGLLFALPVVMVAFAWVYRQLSIKGTTATS